MTAADLESFQLRREQMNYTTRIEVARDGVVDAVLSAEGTYYLKRYWFSEKRSAVSKRDFRSVEDAKAAWKRGRLRWE